MTEFKFFCPQCDRQIQCDTGYIGTQINYPACQKSIVVPQSSQAAAASPAPAIPKVWRNVLIAGGLVVVFVGLVIGVWFGYSKINAYQRIAKLPPGLVSFWSGDGDPNDSVGGRKGQLVNGVGFMPGKMGRAFNLKNGEGGDGGSLRRHSSYVQIQTGPARPWTWARGMVLPSSARSSQSP